MTGSGVAAAASVHVSAAEEAAGRFALADRDRHQVDRHVRNENVINERIFAMPVIQIDGRQEAVLCVHLLTGGSDRPVHLLPVAVSVQIDVLLIREASASLGRRFCSLRPHGTD